ncbi:MAG: hypothetical protein ACFFBD_28885, partial [Candidatus Hodarchaeota archaeon]
MLRSTKFTDKYLIPLRKRRRKYQLEILLLSTIFILQLVSWGHLISPKDTYSIYSYGSDSLDSPKSIFSLPSASGAPNLAEKTMQTPSNSQQTHYRSASYNPHDSILINGDSDFLNQATIEGWVGTGTASDPIIISDYILTSSSSF